ncbi:MAG: BREX system P-loop protein BrxC [Thermoguttaceae bacterium]|nr:BREX system P-loop protein BrxC [Thermoguttaceae bacterium]
MRIQSMFKDDINRKINGVVKVNQDEKAVLVQELNEYVITRELKKHFHSFFTNYVSSFSEATADIGVWISGFFGSGKSHFLKMLSYLLENREVDGIKTVERFRQKFADDPGTFELIDNATKGKTDTILFNIDIEGSIKKDQTAVLRVFAKMFYKYLGFYGEDLKVAKLEQFIAKQGKTEEFRRVFEEKNGASWLETRDTFDFIEDDLVAVMVEVLGMSELAARNWFNGTETVETSIAKLVSEIKEYVDRQPDDFRLLFMIDEVGQYVGGDTSLLLNLQSLLETIGSECRGKVWVVCTGQEAIDEIIKARENEFSRIQARFKTRLSLSSSSADEVIQKRILLKTEKTGRELENVYTTNDSVLRNLFTFTDAVRDIKGYSDAEEFTKNFPFVPYQFILLQKVFAEIRKHGNSGKHLSGGERSMLSGFQEAAQKIQDKDQYALAPFYLFYDTVHSFLDSSIRLVIERCERAADNGDGIEPQDVNVLKLLYLVRYVDDVKANLDNIVILMADDIRLDKIDMREQVRNSLNRLMSQNYIGRTGAVYNFLTDEEQDIQREIRNTSVNISEIVNRIAEKIFADIYTNKKFRYEKYDFAFDQMVDTRYVGTLTGGMLLQILTLATDPFEKEEGRLMLDSQRKAIIALAENSYYEFIESAMKIRKYIKHQNVAQLPKSRQDIIHNHQEEAGKYELAASDLLAEAIVNAEFYVYGEKIELKKAASSVAMREAETPEEYASRVKTAKAKAMIDQVLECLVTHVYSEIGLITKFSETDADIMNILRGEQAYILDSQANRDAADKVERYLELQHGQNISTAMSDLQDKFQKQPYGWREIDIAAVVALLIHEQKVTIKYGGETIQPGDPRLPDLLRKKSEIGKTSISMRQVISIQKIRKVREFMREFFDKMDVPEDEDGLIKHIQDGFSGMRTHLDELNKRYTGHDYPDQKKVSEAIVLIKDVLSQTSDNIALIQRVIDREDALYGMQEELQDVEDFFNTRVTLFDSAVRFEENLRVDSDYIAKDDEAAQALEQIRQIITIPANGKFCYKRIPELNALTAKVRDSHDKMLETKREELLEIVRQCLEEIHTLAMESNSTSVRNISNTADNFFAQQKEKINSYQILSLLDGLVPQIWKFKDDTISRIDAILHPPVVKTPAPLPEPKSQPKPKEEVIKSLHRQLIFPAKTLRTEAEIDTYIESIRANMKQHLKGCDGIRLS